MAAIASTEIFLFEKFRFDRRAGVLFECDQEGVFEPLAVGSRAAEVLGVLVDHPGDLVSRDEIMAAVWPGTVIEDGNLSVQISALRRVLDNGRSEGSLIQTVPGRGYRFLGQVRQYDPDQLPLSPDHCADADADLPPRFANLYGCQYWSPAMICWGLGGFGVGLTGALEVNTKEDMGANAKLIVLWGATSGEPA